MRIGYSFWGFIGPGIADTPDGGRSFRAPLLDALADRHQVILLQDNRDLHEAGDDLTGHYTFDAGLPNLDALFLEWRWPLPGRNTTACGTHGHTCDLHRQQELLDHYTLAGGLPTIAWDLDRVTTRTTRSATIRPSPSASPPPAPPRARTPCAVPSRTPPSTPLTQPPWSAANAGGRWSTSTTSTAATPSSTATSHPPPTPTATSTASQRP
ncbi:hypothetical protein POF50_032745 [Streptomyces sp. SL13]|uniref:Uncharacterized protein n=1 Tax=Streptantibioticus silvisoli TaxID=2705255 RepID=A0AA90HE46_9ACTN|nr:hypothetical protein [Streptantibioticus silvisoli]MDI5974060.1 hypothetical protein [Streptantibioticus silvisoli]